MGLVWRGLLVISVFAGFGVVVSRLVIAHSTSGAPLAQVQLSAAMAGLFAGGAAAAVVMLILAFGGRRQR